MCVCVCVCVETCHFHRALPCKTLTQPPEEVPPASAFHKKKLGSERRSEWPKVTQEVRGEVGLRLLGTQRLLQFCGFDTEILG